MSDEGSDPLVPTAPENIPVSLRGFADAEHAERFGHVIAYAVRWVSEYIDLERLDGITVAFDYEEALAQLDRGFPARRLLTRTADDRILGVAMAPAVLRDGHVKAHLVFHAPLVLPLEDEENDGFRQALYLVAHECAHIEDLKHRDECFPGTILQREITDVEEAILEQISSAVWDEYAACRASAVFGEDQTAIFEESFTAVLRGARKRTNAAIRSYRFHGEIDRVLKEAGRPLCEPLRLAAYLTGHLDGLGLDLEHVPKARDLLVGSPYDPFVNRMREAVRELWSRRGAWSSPAEFEPLYHISRDLLADGGLTLERLPNGELYVNIPFSPETMP